MKLFNQNRQSLFRTGYKFFSWVYQSDLSKEIAHTDSNDHMGAVVLNTNITHNKSVCLFYIYVMPDNITSTVWLFADDTIAYVTVSSDTNTMQEDLNKLAKWGEKWIMQFHPDKCVVSCRHLFSPFSYFRR